MRNPAIRHRPGARFIVQTASTPTSADEFATKDDAVTLVHHAIARVAEVGMDTARRNSWITAGNSSIAISI